MSVSINLLPSKSIYHRVSICSFLESLQGITSTTIKGHLQDRDLSTDMRATREAVDRLHALLVSVKKAELKHHSVSDFVPILPVGDSGATLRFFLPLVAALGVGGKFVMDESLYRRPIMMLLNTLKDHGCSVNMDDDKKIINLRGQLTPGEYRIKGKESSQFISGLLMALPILYEESTLIVEKPIASQSYIEMTITILSQFGITIAKKHESHELISYSILGNQVYRGPGEYKVEGDWSSASFWLIAEKISGKPIFLQGIGANSIQGDSKIRDFLKEMSKDGDIEIDAASTPDLVPNLAVFALTRKGTTRFSSIDTLALKESDRIEGIQEIVNAVGGKFEYEAGDIIIHGGIDKDSEDKNFIYIMTQDHRMVMMAALVSLISKNPVIIDGWRSVSKSYPNFFKDLKTVELDGKIGLA